MCRLEYANHYFSGGLKTLRPLLFYGFCKHKQLQATMQLLRHLVIISD